MPDCELFSQRVDELSRLLYQLPGGRLPDAVNALEQLAQLARHYQAMESGAKAGGDSCAHLCHTPTGT